MSPCDQGQVFSPAGPAALLLADALNTGLGAFLLVFGLLGLAVTLGAGAFWLTRRRGAEMLLAPPPRSLPPAAPAEPVALSSMPAPSVAPVAPAAPVSPPRDARAAQAPPAASDPGGLACAALCAWLTARTDEADMWTAFDQLVRETLTEQLGATRIRCYHVRAGADLLTPISQRGKGAPLNPPSAREGLLAHVATTGKEYAAGEPGNGPLVEQLAAQESEPWAWVWPVWNESGAAGLIAVGRLQNGALRPTTRRALGPLLSLCWQYVACNETLRIVQRTDKGSGVLTRNDFFTLAARALDESYHANEPVVVTVLALEGLRRLDDHGLWRQRDALIEQLGNAIPRRLRSDDLVGRFADDRFVLLLRRLDTGLGRLITEKMLGAATECLGRLAADDRPLALRAGVVGSALERPALDTLLIAAFDAVERARKLKLDVVSGDITEMSTPPSS